MCKDDIVILSILQSYVFYWYYRYLLHLGMDKMKVIICQNIYCPRIRNSVQEEVTSFDTCQHTKQSIINMVNYQLRNLRKCHGTNSL